jgi:hypothetical protein
MRLMDRVLEGYVLWRPLGSPVRRRLKALKAMPVLAHVSRSLNSGNRGLSAWRSFHFVVTGAGTAWLE